MITERMAATKIITITMTITITNYTMDGNQAKVDTVKCERTITLELLSTGYWSSLFEYRNRIVYL